jgi:deazaflavin-dependent oxidoreductase (nitroreductase family)
MPTDDEFLAYNRGVIEEFRANSGVVSEPPFPIVLLTTTGARTGRRTTTPVARASDGERVFVVASKAGGPTHPAWFHNLVANPAVTVETGAATYDATAVPVEGEERDRLYELARQQVAAFGEVDHGVAASGRIIPVVVLEGVPAP